MSGWPEAERCDECANLKKAAATAEGKLGEWAQEGKRRRVIRESFAGVVLAGFGKIIF